MGTDCKPLLRNVSFSNRDDFDSVAHEIELSDLHFAKNDSQITSTDAETATDCKPVLQNVSFSSRDNIDTGGNEIGVRDSHHEKHN
jgi:hypothetical protein